MTPEKDNVHIKSADLGDELPVDDVAAESSWKPTRKWWAQVTGGLAAIGGSWILTGAFDDVERGMTATLLAAAVASYWFPNQPTAGGVPDA